MRKFLRFSLIVTLLCICSSTYALKTVTFDATVDKTESAAAGNDLSITKDGVTILTSNGIFGNGTEYRVYKSATFTVSTTSGNITSVIVTCTANGTTKYGPGCYTVDTGDNTYETSGKTGTWTGNASSIVFTASTNQVRMTKVEVTIDDNTSLSAPTISGNTPFESSTTVTLTAEDGASIYYTTDDSDPTTASTQYSTPFTLNESATVKAIAVKDGKTSSIASKEFTKVTFTDATIADLNGYTEDKAYINLSLNNAKVVYVDGKNIHLRENGKALMMYATNMTGLTLNATVSGTIKVDYDNYNGIHEVKDNTFTNTENLTFVAGSSEELDATETTISALLNKEHISDLVVIKNVSITTPDNSKYYVSDGTNEIQLWGNVEISKASVGKTTDVYALYNTIYQGTTPEIKPVSIDGVTTGINKVEVSKSDSKLYNTAGQRVDSAYKGIVIKNGKKVLVK